MDRSVNPTTPPMEEVAFTAAGGFSETRLFFRVAVTTRFP
jgi:hypothetical protein